MKRLWWMFCVVRSKLLTSYYIVDNKALVATGNCLTRYSFVLCCVGIALLCFASLCFALCCAVLRDIARCVRCCARYMLGMGTAGVIMHAVSRIKQYSCSFHRDLMSTVRYCGSRVRRCNGNCWQRLLGVVRYRSFIQKSMYPRW